MGACVSPIAQSDNDALALRVRGVGPKRGHAVPGGARVELVERVPPAAPCSRERTERNLLALRAVGVQLVEPELQVEVPIDCRCARNRAQPPTAWLKPS
jgi:hypothetical protein